MATFVYILKCNDGTYYSGMTDNLKRRLLEHKKGEVFSTKNLEPKLVYYSCFSERYLAVDFEKYLKSNSGRGFRNKHLITQRTELARRSVAKPR